MDKWFLCGIKFVMIIFFYLFVYVKLRMWMMFLNNCGGYFNMGCDNNDMFNNMRKCGLVRLWIKIDY